MTIPEKLYLQLQQKYGLPLPFKQICTDEGIIATRARLGEDLFGMYIGVEEQKYIILNDKLPFHERRDWAFHELYHHFYTSNGDIHYAQKEDARATLFAALCRIPKVEWNDTVAGLIEQFNVSPWIAKARLQHEARRLDRQ